VNSICLNKNYSTTRLLTTEWSLTDQNSIDNNIQTKSILGKGGLRTKGYFKHSYKKQINKWYLLDADGQLDKLIKIPFDNIGDELSLITVITVVFNGEKYLEETILSVISQKYSNVEYIIIDGGSTDGTIEIIKKYEHAIDYWVSEKDQGIFDAMNKGAFCSKGSYIYFLNSDDYLLADTLNIVSHKITSKVILPDVLYGNIFSLSKDGYKTLCPTPKGIIHGYQFYNLPFHHPGSLIKSSTFKRLKGFSIDFRYSSDYDLFLRAFNEGCIFEKVEYSFSCMREGGLGTQNLGIAISEFKRSLLINKGSIIALLLCKVRGSLLLKKQKRKIFGKYIAKFHSYFIRIKYGKK
jgi:glycosyltransferase involved in cell wall biosynthesis